MPDTGKERRVQPDWFEALCQEAEQLGERANQDFGDYAAYSSIMNTIGGAEEEREAALAKARKEGREEVLKARFCDALIDEVIVGLGGKRGFTYEGFNFPRWGMKAALERAIERVPLDSLTKEGDSNGG